MACRGGLVFRGLGFRSLGFRVSGGLTEFTGFEADKNLKPRAVFGPRLQSL